MRKRQSKANSRTPSLKVLRAVTRRVHNALKLHDSKHNHWYHGLCGACAIGATMVHNHLRVLGYQSEIVMGEGDFSSHCWVECVGMVCDPTVGQFARQPPWHVIPVKRAKRLKAYKLTRVSFDTDGWPRTDQPEFFLAQRSVSW